MRVDLVGQDARGAQVVGSRRRTPAQALPVQRLRLLAAHEEDVGGQRRLSRGTGGTEPQRDVGKDGGEGLELDLHVGGLEVVVVEPLAEDAPRRQARRARSRRNSRVNRFETPEIQGFDGSETITSRRRASAAGGCGRRGTRSRKRGSLRSGPESSAKKGAASQVAGSISTHSSLSSGCRAAAAAAVAPAPQPITSTRRGARCSSIGTWAMNFWVTTSSAPLPASVLPFTERKRRPDPRSDDRHHRLAPPRRGAPLARPGRGGRKPGRSSTRGRSGRRPTSSATGSQGRKRGAASVERRPATASATRRRCGGSGGRGVDERRRSSRRRGDRRTRGTGAGGPAPARARGR